MVKFKRPLGLRGKSPGLSFEKPSHTASNFSSRQCTLYFQSCTHQATRSHLHTLLCSSCGIPEHSLCGYSKALGTRPVPVVSACEQLRPSKRTAAGILTSPRDWWLFVDPDRQLKFPNHFIATALHQTLSWCLSQPSRLCCRTRQCQREIIWERPLKGSLTSTKDCSATAGWMESKVFPSRGQMQGIHSLIFSQSLQTFVN